MPNVVVVGSFDTKQAPLTRLVKSIQELGGHTTTVDTSVYPNPVDVDVPAETVAAEGSSDYRSVPGLGRAIAVHVMAVGAAAVLARLGEEGKVDAVVCLGGSNAATVFSKIATVLPTGIPKVLMSTVVAGDTRPMIQASDAIMLYSIVDIEGMNAILAAMIDRLAAVVVGAANAPRLDMVGGSTSDVGISMFGVTTRCVARCRSLLEDTGLDVLAFHANGSGGQSLERFANEGLVSSVLDITTTELADELLGGMFSAGPSRMTAAARRGLPQVVSAGAIDMINFGPLHTVPDEYRHRNLLPHNDLVTLVRTTPSENRLIGHTLAERLGACTAPTTVAIPMRGVSELDIEGGPFFDPDAINAFLDGLRSTRDPSVQVVEVDSHINDPDFADALVALALKGRQHLSDQQSAVSAGTTDRS